MTSLTNEQKDALDQEIDAAIPFGILAELGREVALLHLLRYQAAVLDEQEKLTSSQDHKRLLDRFRDAVNIATGWIFKICTPSGVLPPQTTDPEVLRIMSQLLSASLRYSAVLDVMNVIRQELKNVELNENTVVTSFSDDRVKNLDVIDSAVSLPEPSIDNIDFESVCRQLNETGNLRSDALYEIEYKIDPNAFDLARDTILRQIETPWTLNPAWDVGGYTLAQYRVFWVHLQTFAFIHNLFCGWAADRLPYPNGAIRYPVNSAIPVRDRDDWIKFICALTELDESVVGTIIDDLTLDFKLLIRTPAENGKPANKLTDAVYQPFVPIGDFLALNTTAVQSSNAERNHWDLLSVLRPSIFDSLSSKKESYWLDQLKPVLEKHGLKIRTIKVKDGDVDAMVFDEVGKFAVAIQMKFLMQPDRIKRKDIDLVRKGQTQIMQGVAWIKENLKLAAEKLKMKESELAEYNIQPLVLTKNSMLIGYLPDEIPVLNEFILLGLLERTQPLSIRQIWLIAKHKLYCKNINTLYSEMAKTLTFGDKIFEVQDYSLQRDWNLDSDIDFEQLETLSKTSAVTIAE